MYDTNIRSVVFCGILSMNFVDFIIFSYFPQYGKLIFRSKLFKRIFENIFVISFLLFYIEFVIARKYMYNCFLENNKQISLEVFFNILLLTKSPNFLDFRGNNNDVYTKVLFK